MKATKIDADTTIIEIATVNDAITLVFRNRFVPRIVILGEQFEHNTFASDYVQFQLQEMLGECRKLHGDGLSNKGIS